MSRSGIVLGSLAILFSAVSITVASEPPDARLDALKQEAVAEVESMRKFTQVAVDSIFSYGELGMQEFETQRYLTGILEEHGFEIELGVAGMPSAWTARWGSGSPVIALGSDVDGIPQSNQKPGVGYRDNLVYRPMNEAQLDIEVAIEFEFVSASIQSPSLFVRAQYDTIGDPAGFDSYDLWVENADKVTLARNSGTATSRVTTFTSSENMGLRALVVRIK